MEYKGKLYGKIGGMYFDTSKTSEDWDNLENKVNELQEVVNKNCTIPVVNAWVAVDTPPKVDYFYLAYDQDLCMITKALFDGGWHANEDDFNVTHWMELPKPPLR